MERRNLSCVSREPGHTKGHAAIIFIPCTRNNLLSTTLTFPQMPGRGAHLPSPAQGIAFLYLLLNSGLLSLEATEALGNYKFFDRPRHRPK